MDGFEKSLIASTEAMIGLGMLADYKLIANEQGEEDIWIKIDRTNMLLTALHLPVYAVHGGYPEEWDTLSSGEKKYRIYNECLDIWLSRMIYGKHWLHMAYMDHIDVDTPACLGNDWRIYRSPLPDLAEEFEKLVNTNMKDIGCPVPTSPESDSLLLKELDLISRAETVGEVAIGIGIPVKEAIERMWDYAQKGFLVLK